MATKKISALSTGTTANATDKLPIERSGANAYITPLMLQTYMLGNIGLLSRYHNSGALSYADGSTTIINFNTSDYDPLSLVATGASWTFTAPVTGWYDVRIVGCLIDPNGAAWAAANGCRILLYKGGVNQGNVAYQESDGTASTGHWLFLPGSRGISLTATNTIDLRFDNFSGATRLINNLAAIEIYRVH